MFFVYSFLSAIPSSSLCFLLTAASGQEPFCLSEMLANPAGRFCGIAAISSSLSLPRALQISFKIYISIFFGIEVINLQKKSTPMLLE